MWLAPHVMLHMGGAAAPLTSARTWVAHKLVELEMRCAQVAVARPWNGLKSAHPVLGPGASHRWVVDDDIAMTTTSEAGRLRLRVARSPGRHAPAYPGQRHLTEGLDDGFARSATMHRALVDGYTAMKVLQRRLSTSRDDLESRPLLAAGPRSRRTKERAPMAPVASAGTTVLDGLLGEEWEAGSAH